MWKIFLVLGTVAAAIAALFGYARYLEKVSVFFPEKELLYTPRDIGLQFRDLEIPSVNGQKINAWFIPAPQARYTVLVCHGNAGNLSTRLEKIRLLHSLGLSILIFDYQGYGKSTGSPSEAGVYHDASAACRYLEEELKVPPSGILIYGESLGGAVAVDLARNVEVAGLILESTFSSGTDMARKIYPFMPAFIFSIKFDSFSKISSIRAPKLFIHSREDEIIPLSMARKLYARAPAPKDFVTLSGSHNDAYSVSQSEYLTALSSFLKKIEGH